MKAEIDKYTFDINQYQFIKEINRGGFGVISLVRDKNTGKQYAAKTNLIDAGISLRRGKQLISREVGILIRVKHPTIICFKGYSPIDFDGKRNITILMDYMKGGSLSELISLEGRGLSPKNYDNTKRQIILIGISRGMKHLHQLHIIHRDLKPENILLNDDLQPRITDFGLSKFFDPLSSVNQSVSETGTAPYMAPEVIQSDRFNTKADVYAFGILMNEVLSGKRAYSDLLNGSKKKTTIFNLKQKVCRGLRPNIDPNMKKGLKKMIEHCLSENPKERPSFSEIFNKLSLSKENEFFQFENRAVEPDVISSDDDDDDDKKDEDSDDAGIFLNKKYCLEDVDYDEVLEYVDKIYEEEKYEGKNDHIDSKKDEEIAHLKEIIEELKVKDKEKEKEINDLKEKISKLEAKDHEKEETQEKLKDQIQKQSNKNKDMKRKIQKVERLIDEHKKGTEEKDVYIDQTKISKELKLFNQYMKYFCFAEPSIGSPGLLEQLKLKEENKFDRLFIASQSKTDIYNLIDPNSNDYFSTSNSGKFFIEFEFENSIMINGIQIFSYTRYFPKSFDISVNDKIIKSINEAIELNGKNQRMTIKFKSLSCDKIRITQTGPSWDKNTNFLFFKRIEILSNEPKYEKGIFSTFIKNSKNNDPHNCPVYISSSNLDFNSFYKLDANKIICTDSKRGSWFQIEITKGYAILNGYRLERTNPDKLRNYKIICTDDINQEINEWTTLIEINEKDENEHTDPDVYYFTRPSPPTKYIRLIMTDKNWNDNYYLQFYHFDFFGRISLDNNIYEIIDKRISTVDSKIGRIITAEPNDNSPGLLEQLKLKEENKFDRLFIASQSNTDIYNLIDPNSNDYFSTSNSGKFFIEFEFENSIMINGIQIFSDTSSFPKSFDISVNEEIIKSIKEANELNGENQRMTIKFKSISCEKIRITQTGPNWDDNDNFLIFKRIEILSKDPKYEKGVFSTFIKNSKNNDPHNCPVYISSLNLDFNSFYKLDANKIICINFERYPWFQIEITKGYAILNGYRLKRTNSNKLRNYKIICTDDINQEINEWTTLIEINEKDKNEHADPDVYYFTRPSPPTKYIRLIMTDKNWDDNYNFKFYHFDFFGRISLDNNIYEIIDKRISTIDSKIGHIITAEPNDNSPGLLERLKKIEETKFDRLFISSQSSLDIYNLIDPNSNDYYETSNSGKFFIEFEFENLIMINGIQIFSDTCYFPKSFDISVNDEIIKSIKEATELNGKNQRMTIKFKSISCEKIRITQTGPNWDDNDNFLFFKRIEILSKDPKYEKGVFSTFIKNSKNNDPHNCPVYISSYTFNSNSFYLPQTDDFVYTSNKMNSWFQIEFTKGFVILQGFRFHRNESLMRSYKIICTDDIKKPIDSWTTLMEINEKREDEHQIADIYIFPHQSPLTTIVRIFSTGPKWDGSNGIEFYHLDFFGSYF